MSSLPTLEGLRALLAPLDSSPVECDGLTRLVVTRLAEEGIPCQAFVGRLSLGGRIVQPHFWVESSGYRIDYRARMWLGDAPEVPHGVFPLDGIAEYMGNPVLIAPLPTVLFQLLAGSDA